jgi:hypothetical protein
VSCESHKNCKECYFGYDRKWDGDKKEYRCKSNGRIGYSAVAVTGGLVGLIGGLFFYSKKKRR